ncbi:MAG: TolC family protein [bacterium]|nr:TolC family protein [bacterium]
MDRQYWTPATKQTKRILLGALIAASMSGCATQRGVQIASDTQKATSFVAAETVSTNTRPEAIAYRSVETPVQLAGFNDGMVVASPAAFTLPQDNDGELGLDSEEADVSSRSFSDFLQLDPPEEDGERGSQGDGESDEDEVRNTDSQTPPRPECPTPRSPTAPGAVFGHDALSRHPKILAARQRVAAASNVIPQAKALPDPTFNNTFWPFHDNALQTAGGRVGNQMSVNQKVPFPDKLKTKAIIASREVQIAQTEVDGIAREITESVRLAYYEVWFATRAIAIIEETKDLVADLTDVAEARYRSGGSQQDVLRAQLETDRLDEQLITLRRQKQVAQADLATLLQQPVDLLPEATDELGITDTPQQIEELIALAEQCNPKLRGLAWEIQRDRDKERLACLQQYPDFNVGLSWGLISDGHDVISPVANGNDNLSISFGTTLPIWREKINAGIREAAHRRSSTTRRLEAERDELYGKIRRLIVQADALAEQRDIYENRIIPRTEGTLELSIADYRGKRTDFFTLIETYRELLMFETQLARIDATLAGTIAQLDRTVGCPQ